jgi:hypothetical protein
MTIFLISAELKLKNPAITHDAIYSEKMRLKPQWSFTNVVK